MDIKIPMTRSIKNAPKPLPSNLIKSSEDDKPINTLPDYEIRTMKDDIAELGLKKLQREASGIPISEEEIEAAPKTAPTPSRELPKKIEGELMPQKEIPTPPKKSILPGTEELVAPKEDLFIPSMPRPEREKEEMPPLPQMEEAKIPPELSYEAPLPSPKKKILSLILIIAIAAGLGIGGFFLIKAFSNKGGPTTPTPNPPITAPKLSPALISVNETKTISLAPDKSLFELLREETTTTQENKTFERIGVLKNEKEFLSSVELLQNLEVAIPPFALSYIKGNYNLLIYGQSNGKRLGLIAEIENPENFKEQLRIWEGTMLDDFKNFYPIHVPGPRASQNFLDDIYLNVAIRYVNLPKPDLTLNYTILNNLFIVGTSKETIYTIIEKVLGF
jgi:hypothetical protein